MTEHDLKCWPGPFGLTLAGLKPFEIRRDDRHYAEGDTLRLREWDPERPEDDRYTGREHRVLVTCVTSGWGLPEGLVVLGIEPAEPWGDRPLPEDREIKAAHPLVTGDHALRAEAMRLVSARHSKGALVDLVNWLLARNKSLEDQLECAGEMIAGEDA